MRRGRSGEARELARRQHGVIARSQLLALGFTPSAIRHRRATGRLRVLHRGVYVVGSIPLDRRFRWSAGLLASGSDSALWDASAGAILGLTESRWPNGRGIAPVEVVVPAGRHPSHQGIRAHQSASLCSGDGTGEGVIEVIEWEGMRVAGPTDTLLALACRLSRTRLERAVNAADRARLITPEKLRLEIENRRGASGLPALRALLDRSSFALTDSELESRFLRIVLSAGLPKPLTQVKLNGHRVDFFWRDLGLVVETDGLTYHRTAMSQSRDLRRDQAHTLAGLTCLRFSHAQVVYETGEVRRTLSAVAERLAA